MSRGIDDTWIRCFHPQADGRAVRLICFPHAGGSASYYFALSALLAPTIEVMAVQYPGRQDRRQEKCIESIPELADAIFDALPFPTDQRLAFFGHSMGALVAFEVAQRLRAQQRGKPLWLFASARRAPSLQRFSDIHRRTDPEIAEELKRVGGTDARWLSDDELFATIMPVIRSDYRAIETYNWTPMPLLPCPVTALVGTSDPHTSLEDAAAWRHHTSGGFVLEVFPGGHFYLDARRREVRDIIVRAIAPEAANELSDEASA